VEARILYFLGAESTSARFPERSSVIVASAQIMVSLAVKPVLLFEPLLALAKELRPCGLDSLRTVAIGRGAG